MIKAFWEVLKDLWNFVLGRDGASGLVSSTTVNVDTKEIKKTNNKNIPNSPFSGVVVPSKKAGQALGRAAYVQSDTVMCLSGPDLGFDTKVGQLSYGERVMVSRIKEGYAEIQTTLVRGWVGVEVLTDDPHKVFPNLRSAYIYNEKNEETVKLRRFLNDETLAAYLKLPLQSVEFGLYILKYFGINVAWPPVRPRDAGAWQGILRGVKGVTMSVEPKTSAILEYAGSEETRFIGYVEAVHPDQSITLQSVGRLEEGEYRVEEFTKEEWKEWRPVFISFA